MTYTINYKSIHIDGRKLFMSQKEAKKYLGVSTDWLEKRREEGRLHHSKVANTIFYLKSEIDNLIKAGAVTGSGEFYRAR